MTGIIEEIQKLAESVSADLKEKKAYSPSQRPWPNAGPSYQKRNSYMQQKYLLMKIRRR